MNGTSDPSLKSFIEVDSKSDFPIQNLPVGIFRAKDQMDFRVGAAIGDFVVDLFVLQEEGLLKTQDSKVLSASSLNPLAKSGRSTWREIRTQLSTLLRHDNPTLRDNAALRQKCMRRQADTIMALPFETPNYTDFYSSEHHATNVGKLFRDKNNPLLPNWKHIPVAYHGRASTLTISGTPIRRPHGQMYSEDLGGPVLTPSRKLDFELEFGFFVGQENPMGTPISIDHASEHIFGYVLVNDWSARDHQSWEYRPLGPFLSKNFATSLSPWVVMTEALKPFKIAMPPQTPRPLPYLQERDRSIYDVKLTVFLIPKGTTEQMEICSTNLSEIYWSPAQQLAHHTVNGCRMEVGDLLASGTISGSDRSAWGSLLEITFNGGQPLDLGQGITRSFLEDGDQVVMRAHCEKDGLRLGLEKSEARFFRPSRYPMDSSSR